jgi:hypothetical protein
VLVFVWRTLGGVGDSDVGVVTRAAEFAPEKKKHRRAQELGDDDRR